MKAQVILATAGTGERLKNTSPKPLVKLDDRPLFAFSLEVFELSSSIDSVIIVAQEELIDVFRTYVQQYNFKKVKHIVAGGPTRYHSVSNGLKKVDEDTGVVLIHDGARPFIDVVLVERVVQLCKKEDAVIVGVKLKPTVKKVDTATQYVTQTLNRDELWEVQTPQAFRKEVILRAHSGEIKDVPTDDAVLVEKLGIKVKVFEGSYKNIKITTPEDLEIAKAFLSCIRK